MKNIYLFILASSISFLGWGQGSYSSANGLFEVDYLKGCEGTTITLTPTGPSGTYFPCFDADLSDLLSTENQTCFENQASEVNKYEFTYTEAGVYDILLLIQLSNSQLFDSLTIEIMDPELPAVALSNCNGEVRIGLDPELENFDFYNITFGDGSPPQDFSINEFPITHNYADNSQSYTIQATGSFDNSGFNNCGNDTFTKNFIPEELEESAAEITSIDLISSTSFEIDYTTNENQIYKLQIKQNNNGSFQDVAIITSETGGTYLFQDLDLNANFYCIRIISESLCNGQSLNSDEICTIRFSGDAGADGNLLDWNSSSFENTLLYKNGVEIYNGDAPFLDINVLCGQSDTYQLVGINASGIETRSLPIDLVAESGTPQIPISQIATRVLSSSEVEISWEVPPGLQPNDYIIYKKRNAGENYFSIGTTSSTNFTDIAVSTQNKIHYYSIVYTNSCGGSSEPLIVAPNILLKANQTENTLTFSWNNYTGYDTLLKEYIVKKYDGDKNLLEEWNQGLETSLNDDVANAEEQKYSYQVEAISENGQVSYSNEVEYKIPSTFFVPSGFTPNGDSRNEEIKVVGKFIDQVEFSIYNRWGTLIFKSNELEKGWDGFLQDREAPEGTYTYTIKVKDEYGEEYFKSGVFNLIR
ncbi:gliding motility-associated C-terminal domain-containing protein [Marivirga sp. S37H4]|uniref:Gliding motility-associated C-terminal domain-containing protein n=1 Tax=Marivirga aurantiaca TaxID=2802615 RepID=A0A934WXS1_9BACT|nr:gliding motility-associated C-terminal domain-containing protein [Marivirga aurantiaca]MBK6264861.1 gliding motility-associated C-terminal domain-containing protein [Marivirga aurantiaca]